MKRTLLALTLFAGLAGTSANASELSYSFIEADYVNAGDLGINFNGDFDGVSLRGSVALGDNFYLQGNYANTSATSDFGVGSDFDTYSLGFGFRHNISDKADLFADVNYVHWSFDTLGSIGADDNGYRVRVGFRGALSDKFEGTIGVTHEDLGDAGDAVSLSLGGQLKFNDTWGAVAEVEAGGDDTRYLVGIRASF
ncbi:MAG: hypothetical protein ACREPB_07785 [Arenimonas sp.]